MKNEPLAPPPTEAAPVVSPPAADESGVVPNAPEAAPTVDDPSEIMPPPAMQVGPLDDMTLGTVPATIPLPIAEEESATIKAEAPENPALVVQFSPAPDTVFTTSLTLNLHCSSPTAQIRYALGADDVDEAGTLFNAQDKILLTEITTVAARAFENGQRGPLLTGRFEIRKAQWLELEPTEQSDPTPHKASEVLASPDGWQSAAGSVRGKLHAHRALWREDSFALANVELERGVWSVIAVSDGAGSAPLSRVGSRLACDASIESLRASLGMMAELSPEQESLVADDLPRLREAMVNCGVAALEAIRGEAQEREQRLSAFAATLLVLVRRQWNNSQLCASLQVGDGSIALWDEAGLTLLGEADHGEHSSETRFLTTNGIEADLASRIKFSIKPSLRAVAVMSDGVSDDYFPEEKRLGQVFEAVLPLVQSEGDAGKALLQWLGYEKKGSSDDRTLVVSWPVTPLPPREATDGAIEAADRDA